ncbi:MAG: dipeptide ABC transporter ATP-binding protein [Gammaproteobacteria bacterium]|nr:dipeptide ABC transporter ATP-binding protein [Gammaproteobacteria bacterium]MCP5136845.1 dipeptide ABC transporter ATP-binding protein [Gammaproteobacteria bacterium]
MVHPQADEILLRVRDLRTWFGKGETAARAVDGLDFNIRRGETFALLGESGCGKSMTALSIMRLVPEPAGRIVSGSIMLGNEQLLRLPESAMRGLRGGRIGMIFQEPMTSLNPVMSIGKQIAESVRRHTGLKGTAVGDRVVELLDQVGIPDPARRAEAFPHQLSGGMKQRVMIAMALAGEPELLIADEPTTALDVTIQAQVLDLLRRLQKERGMAILLITHDLGVVAQMADEVAVMYAGQIVERCSRSRFFARPLHPYSRKLFKSVPDAGRRGAPLAVIRGSVPSLRQAFGGCRFADRCDFTQEDCGTESIPISEPERGHAVRCLYWGALDQSEAVGAVAQRRAAGSHEDEDLLSVSGLKVHFPIRKGLLQRAVGHVRAVDGLDLQLQSGRTVAVVGESGCGKTTVAKAILQLLRPTDGSVRFRDQELTGLSPRALRPRRRDFQIIFQDPYSSMNPRMRVQDIIAEGLVVQGEKGNHLARVAELLQQVGLPEDAGSRYPHEFSGGQRQRISIARALALNPALIVCDEPTSALDVSVQAQILNLLRRLQVERNLAYLFITHNIAVVSYLAHEVVVMYLGRVVEQGPVERVLDTPAHPYTQALLSAVPSMDAGHGREIIRLEGDMPSPSDPPSGCHFHPRCPRAMAVCRHEYPAQTALQDGRVVRCHLLT